MRSPAALTVATSASFVIVSDAAPIAISSVSSAGAV
jgi:hypothetical protein